MCYLGGDESYWEVNHPIYDEALDASLTAEQEEALETLTEEERQTHFGHTQVVGTDWTVWDCIANAIPESEFAYQDSPLMVTIGFSALGGDVAWQKINQALTQQLAGREWLTEQLQTSQLLVNDRAIKYFVSPPVQMEEA